MRTMRLNDCDVCGVSGLFRRCGPCTAKHGKVGLVPLIRIVRETLQALKAAEEVMDYMGDILNGMDAVTDVDLAYTEPRWRKVRRALDEYAGIDRRQTSASAIPNPTMNVFEMHDAESQKHERRANEK